MLVSLGAGAAASPVHGVGGHVQASTHQSAHYLAFRTSAVSMRTCKIGNRLWPYGAIGKMPWMYSAIEQMPWMYSTVYKMPWMYSTVYKMPWMYSTVYKMPWMYSSTYKMPWMYAPPARHAPRTRVCLMIFPLDRSAPSQRS
jgi:hypothetical protein